EPLVAECGKNPFDHEVGTFDADHLEIGVLSAQRCGVEQRVVPLQLRQPRALELVSSVIVAAPGLRSVEDLIPVAVDREGAYESIGQLLQQPKPPRGSLRGELDAGEQAGLDPGVSAAPA